MWWGSAFIFGIIVVDQTDKAGCAALSTIKFERSRWVLCTLTGSPSDLLSVGSMEEGVVLDCCIFFMVVIVIVACVGGLNLNTEIMALLVVSLHRHRPLGACGVKLRQGCMDGGGPASQK